VVSAPRLENAACRAPKAAAVFAAERDAAAMKAVCETCWDRPECLAWALERERDGFWGGHDPHERAQVRRRFGIALRPLAAHNIVTSQGG